MDDVTWYDIRVATETSGKQIKREESWFLAKWTLKTEQQNINEISRECERTWAKRF